MWKALALIALLAKDVAAQTGSARGSDFLRFACSQLVVDRVDPLVNPGEVPSSHMHQVVGGNSFNATVLTLPSPSSSPETDFNNGCNRWTQQISIPPWHRNARPASCQKTSATTGQHRYTSSPRRTARLRGSRRWRMGG